MGYALSGTLDEVWVGGGTRIGNDTIRKLDAVPSAITNEMRLGDEVSVLANQVAWLSDYCKGFDGDDIDRMTDSQKAALRGAHSLLDHLLAQKAEKERELALTDAARPDGADGIEKRATIVAKADADLANARREFDDAVRVGGRGFAEDQRIRQNLIKREMIAQAARYA